MYSFPYIILFMISLSLIFLSTFKNCFTNVLLYFFQIGSQCFCGNLIKTHLRVCLIVNVINPPMETLRKRVVQVGEQKYIRIYTYSFETRSKLNKSKMQHHDSLFYSVCFVKKSVYIKASTKIFLVDQRNVETILTVLLVYSIGSILKCWTLVSLLLVTIISSDVKNALLTLCYLVTSITQRFILGK